MASIGNLVVKVSANTAAFRSDLKQAGKSVGGFRGAMGKLSSSMKGFAASMGPAGLALAGLATVVKFAHSFSATSKAIDSAAKSARLLGVELRQLEGIKFGGSLAGVDESKVIGGLKTMQKRLGEAARGSGAALPALEELGLNAEDLVGQDAIKSLIDIADAFDKIEDPAKRAAIASNIFSKGNMEMLLLVGQGGDAIEDMIADMERMSDVTSESASEFEDFNDNMAEIWRGVKEIWNSFALLVAKVVNKIGDLMESAIVTFLKFFVLTAEEGRKLDEALAKIKEEADALADMKAIDAFGNMSDDIDAAAKSLEALAESARTAGEAVLGSMGGELDKLNDVDPMDKMLKQFISEGLASDMSAEEFAEMAVKIFQVRKELEAARAAADDLADVKMEELAEEATHAAKAAEDLRKASLGESLTAQFRTPLEEFVKVAEDLENHLTSGVLVGGSGEETARRAFAAAQANLADSAGTTPDIFTGRAEAGSAEAIKTILRAQAGSSAVNPQEKLLLEGKKQTAHLVTLLGVAEKGVEKIDPPEVAEVNP